MSFYEDKCCGAKLTKLFHLSKARVSKLIRLVSGEQVGKLTKCSSTNFHLS